MLLKELLKLHNAKLAEWSADPSTDEDEDEDPDDMKNAPSGTYMTHISREEFIKQAKERGLFSKEALKKFFAEVRGQSIDNLSYMKLDWLFTDGYTPMKKENQWAIVDGLTDMIDSVIGDEFEAQDRKDAAVIEKIKASCFDDLKYERDSNLKAAKTAVLKHWFNTSVDKGGMNGLSLDDWRDISTSPDRFKVTTDADEHISRSANASVWSYTVSATLDMAGRHFVVDKLHYKSDARSLS